jgi:hypothetical protein
MAWAEEHLQASPLWSSGWVAKYLMPAIKWLPIYLGPEDWEITTLDAEGNRVRPMPPPGREVYWWKLPREYWPFKDEMPWEKSQLGAWPASQVSMRDDPSIWPERRSWPPFGYLKVRMPGDPSVSGDQNPKGNQIAFMNMRGHMRYLSPDEMKVKTAITPLGPRYYFSNPNWEQYEYEWKEFQEVLKLLRRERFMKMMAKEIERNEKEGPRPSKDLFE